MKTVRPKVAPWLVFLAISGLTNAHALDPLGLAEEMPGASWAQVMKEFRRLDTNRDGALSLAERTVGGKVRPGSRNLYHIPDQAEETLPPKWVTGMNIVWNDGTVSRAEFWRLLVIVRSLPPTQRVAVTRAWLKLRRSVR